MAGIMPEIHTNTKEIVITF